MTTCESMHKAQHSETELPLFIINWEILENLVLELVPSTNHFSMIGFHASKTAKNFFSMNLPVL